MLTASMAAAFDSDDNLRTLLLLRPHTVGFDRAPTFAFVSNRADGGFECRVDRRDWRRCRSPHQPRRLADGAHLFEVRAVHGDARDRTPASWRFRVVPRVSVIGRSVLGQPITSFRAGEPWQARKVLVVGQIHGEEPEGLRIIRRLRNRYRDIRGVDLWLIGSGNPDGADAGTRGNARGVDLNRNWSYGWRGGVQPSSGYYPGPRPFSEPESRALARLVRRIDPVISIWYHQPWGVTLIPCDRSRATALRYSRLSGLRPRLCGRYSPGSAINYEAHVLRQIAFVVELPRDTISEASVRRHARAAAVIARGG